MSRKLNFENFLNNYFTYDEAFFIARNLGIASKEDLIIKFNEDPKTIENAIYNIENEKLLSFIINKFIKAQNINFDEYTNNHINKLMSISIKRYDLIKRVKEACAKQVHFPDFLMEEITRDNLSRLKDSNKKYPMISLKDEYKHTTNEEDYNRKAVIVISPNQIITYQTSDSRLLHNYMLNKIETKLYDVKKDAYGFIGQDIQIKLYNLKDENHGMLILVPTPINSMQYRQLRYLNEEIKRLNIRNLKIFGMINSTICENARFASNNIDDLLNNVIVDDKFKPDLEEKYILGYPNYENNFKKQKTKSY